MKATRIEHLAPALSPSETCCYRCGQVFNHHEQTVVKGAPCRDCRQVLRAEGDKTVWRAERARKAA